MNNIENFLLKNFALSKKWFYLAIVSLGLAGIYSIIIVAMRTPVIRDLIVDKNYFKIALVIHVNCSVLIWFLSCCAIVIANICKHKFNYILTLSFWISLIGTIAIVVSPIISNSQPVMNNYVPMLNNLAFIVGLALFLSGIGMTVIISLFSYKEYGANIVSQATYILSLIIVVCFVILYLTCSKIKTEFNFNHFDIYNFYEITFWAFGHLLQFAFTGILIISWIVIASGLNITLIYSEKLIKLLIYINLVFVIVGFYPFINNISINDAHYITFYTNHMIYLGGIVPLIFVVGYIFGIKKANPKSDEQYLLHFFTFSMMMFIIGGVIGGQISGVNVTIPAHYHGSIVSITIALMAVIYILINCYGFNKVKNKLALAQVWIYSVGQLVHITGLALSGGYGVLRKDPNVQLTTAAKINMGLVGAGGLVAIIGGIMFIFICYLSLMRKYERS